ncbi:FAD-dependent oxidoreductase [Streptomyces carminius]|uniref:FAD-dependent oxidoreductase n=1 Tax=Streptomyces carminius TaxID=2665496 RepID=A0A2M8M5Z3_9ACTN|nr:FAD-dependent oxidoreductase [Streptomyces carminius]PJE99606.1 FAD-dependent oxidoreductase [Streptomyces carminius]
MSELPSDHESYWLASAPVTPETSHPPLEPGSETDTEVVVVGGGIAGLCTAWELARAGRAVTVVEADRIAAGVTGHTTAKVTAQHSLIYDELRSKHGAEGARHYARSQQAALEHLVAVVDELGVDCELERVAAYTWAESEEQDEKVRAEAEAAAEAGLPASYVTETGLPFPVRGAVRVADQAQFHPRRYLLALAADLLRHGGRIAERTRVVGLEEGEPCRVTAENGAVVTAREVVVATHYPVFDRAMLFSRLEPHRELVVAAAIPADQDPAGMYITPEDNTRSVRTAPYGDGQRLLIVTGESFLPGTADVPERFARLAGWTAERFPDARIVHRWATQDNGSTDRVPYIGPFHPGARHTYVATGFGGWGMTSGVLAGQLLTAYLTESELPPWAGLYDPRRLPGVREAPALLGLQATVAKHFVGDRLGGSTHADSVEDIDPGSGALVRIGGRRCAVHRDAQGQLHAVSARCTHLGCLVHFNDAELAWECPCHGSRFAPDGSVLQGPAVRPLERRDLGGAGTGEAEGDGAEE